MNIEKEKTQWVAWLAKYGADKFLESFLRNAHGAESTCTHCDAEIYLDLLEGGGVADWKTEDGDYGCYDSPDTTSEGCGSHIPYRLVDDPYITRAQRRGVRKP
jgi:hypothetical protein